MYEKDAKAFLDHVTTLFLYHTAVNKHTTQDTIRSTKHSPELFQGLPWTVELPMQECWRSQKYPASSDQTEHGKATINTQMHASNITENAEFCNVSKWVSLS